ncbi:phospho-sugar mutase [Ruminococcus sp. NK3A76]|uniref:phospho-sugar mutase n=1 Tax=Ruminococcus sp. NK3A76 TaxID=877411 RepID=UPI000491513C|nr:phospho-sugar mutase [Ruminococcus sp. NK3A76]
MKEMELYSLWCEKAVDDPDLVTELKSIEGDEEAIIDRFYRDLEFGTGGLRGVIGAGAYRLNIYTIRRATQGLADYVNGTFENGAVAISYDSRIKSTKFAQEAAAVLAANGIKVYIYKELMPTPCLSWAVRACKAQAGIMITASHNPAKYNGYKVYGEDGCQITLDVANTVIGKINAVDMFGGAKVTDYEAAVASGMISYIGDDIIEAYYKRVLEEGIHTDLVADSGLKVVYTPLNGTGNKPVREILKRIGIKDVTVVPEQEMPDGNFPTCPFPNPEIKEALAKGLELCEKVKPDLLLATDPDCDRVGIAVPDNKNGGYVLFSGNEVGAMLLKYICQERTALGTMPKDPVAVKTIVTTDICKKIAAEYNVELREVLTGFKFIGEQIGFLEQKGEDNRYIFGFEESYGYLSGGYVRDKDAVNASMLICEMAAFYRTKGISLLDAREAMYQQYGNYVHTQSSFQCEGASGMERMKEIMSSLRSDPPKTIGGLKVEKVGDYIASEETDLATGAKTAIELPKSDVLAFRLEQGASVIIRPSGTEPKIKAYYTTIGDSRDAAKALEETISADFAKILGF